MNRSDIYYRAALALIAFVYVLLRFQGLTDSCLWFDEIFGVHAAEHSFGEMLWFVAQDLIHPPLFYVLLKGWIATGGESLFWLRSFSVFFSLAALAPFLLLCKELKLSYPARITALVFLATNGSLIKYAQEARMYGLLFFLSLVSTWLFARFFFRGKNVWILTLVNILLVYTHYFGWLVVASEIAAILIFQRMKIRNVLIMGVVAAACYVPWFWAIAHAVADGSNVTQNIGWIERPGAAAFLDLIFDLVEPFYVQASNLDPSTIFIVSIPIILVVAVAKLDYLANWKKKEEKLTLLLLSVFAVLPIVSAFVLSWVLPVSIWGSRHLIIVFAPMAIVIGILIDEISKPVLKAILIGALVFFFLIAFTLKMIRAPQEQIWCAWEQQARSISPDELQTVYVFEDLTAYHFWFATRDEPNIRIVKVNDVPEMSEDKAYFLPRGFDGVRSIAPNEISGDRFLVAFRDMKFDERHPPLNFLIEKGYKISDPAVIDAGGLKAILVSASK
ncbi:MAG: glycosyltransferase family 39 protein [Pyrinomonadaceae bacterium]